MVEGSHYSDLKYVACGTWFLGMGEREVELLCGGGEPYFRLSRKLRMLKEDIKRWNRETFGRIGNIMEVVRRLDEKESLGALGSDEAQHREELKMETRRLLISEEVCWRQKSLVFWLSERDTSTRSFYCS